MLKRYLRLLVAVSFAGYLLFFFFEALSPRMEAIAEFEERLRGITQTTEATVTVLTSPLSLYPNLQGER
jgi:hypothetical protein